MDIVVALLIGALVGWLIGRRRRVAATGFQQAGLARAWQEGYDAGSVASRSKVAWEGASPRTQTPQTSQGPEPLAPAAVPSATPAHQIPPLPSAAPASASASPSRPVAAPVASSSGTQDTASGSQWRPATAEELAAEKHRRDHRNVNITLYVACLLLIAAASLFIGSALPASARMVGLVAVTALFYVGGLVVHAASRRVRPAATAFTGTGLAMVPICGLALDTLVLQRPVTSWLITSAVGTVLMVVAAARLRSRVVAYLTVPFLLSTVIASGAAVQQGMVWGLVASIGLATVMAWLTADEARADWMPEQFRAAMADLHHWITPGMVLLSLIIGTWLRPIHFVALLLAAGAYYVTVAVLGRRSLRLYATYAARASVTAAVGAFVWMLEGSAQMLTGATAAVLTLQTVLITWALWRDRHSSSVLIAAGFLPARTASRADQVACAGLLWCLALTAQVFLPRDTALPISLAWALLVVVAILVAVTGVISARSVAVSLAWQTAVPLALIPGAVLPMVQTPWRLISVVALALLLQVVLALILRRSGHHSRPDARLALDLGAVMALVLAALLVDRWDGTGPQVWPAVVVVVLSVAWAGVHAFRPGEREDVLDAGAWSVFALIAMGGAVSASSEAREPQLVHTVVLALMLVVGAGSVWWLRGRLPEAVRTADGRPVSPELTMPLGLVLGTGALVLAVGWALLELDGALWLSVVALTLTAIWLSTLALLGGERLARGLRVAVMLAGQAVLALAVASAVDLLGGDGAAARGAAAVTLAGGLWIRHLLRHRSGGLAVNARSTWAVVGGLGLLWLFELVDTQDRAALTVIALGIAAVGVVLGGSGGGRWALLGAISVTVAGWSDLVDLRHGGWLPEPLFPAAVAAALYLLLMLKLTLDEARGDVRTAGLFRPVAWVVLWALSVLCATTPQLRLGVLAVAVAVAALTLYVLARVRNLPLLVLGAVLGVPGVVLLVLSWGRVDADWSLETRWWPAAVGVVSLGLLWAWAAVDRRDPPSTRSWGRAALMEYGGWAVLLLTGLVGVSSTHDAVVVTGCALTALGTWLPVLWWRRPTDPFPTAWRRHAVDAAVLATVLLVLRAWWQVAEIDSPLQAIWWSMHMVVLTLAGIAVGHLRDQEAHEVRRRRAVLWGASAAAVMTAAGVVVLMDGSTLLQLLSLLGFVALLVVGLTTRTSLFIWWGAAGVTVSVLWYLRGYTVLWLTLLGVVLIVVAVRQLMRGTRQEDHEDGQDVPDERRYAGGGSGPVAPSDHTERR